jgi:hypothetical protein
MVELLRAAIGKPRQHCLYSGGCAMNMARTVTGLSLAIDAYRAAPYVWGIGTRHLTRGDEVMLDRLRESKETALALAEWELPAGKRPVFLANCLEAHRQFNGGHEKKVKALGALPRPDKARKGLAEAASYFSKHGHRLRLDPKAIRDGANLFLGPDPDVVSEAIALLVSLIDSAEDTKKSSKPTVSRKGEASAKLSAIGVLKEGVRRLSGSPNLKAVEDIAGVVLDCEITADDVNNARKPSEWLGEWGKRPMPRKAK